MFPYLSFYIIPDKLHSFYIFSFLYLCLSVSICLSLSLLPDGLDTLVSLSDRLPQLHKPSTNPNKIQNFIKKTLNYRNFPLLEPPYQNFDYLYRNNVSKE